MHPLERHAVITHDASAQGIPALRSASDNNRLLPTMVQMNHKSSHMDAEDYNTGGPGNVSEVVAHVKQARQDRMGVISMKLVGEGSFTTRDDRQAALKFAFRNAGVDSVTLGYKSTAEIDEAIENLNLALA